MSDKNPRKKKKNPSAVKLGKLGGVVGGPARARALSKTARQQIASLGGKARQQKKRGS